MIILSCDQITKSFGINTILDKVVFSVNEGDRVGIVGANGAGKSTLIKIIHGDLLPDSGIIYKAKDISIGYLPQEGAVDSTNTIWDEMLTVFEPLINMEKQLASLEQQMGNFQQMDDRQYQNLLNEYSALREEFESRDGYSYQSFMRGVLSGLGFSTQQFEQPINHLSGGQKTRVALAKLLLIKPDLLLLDEPTNHLDLEATQWLEDFLKDYPGTIIMISHDRYFLDRLSTAILEIENQKAYLYTGNYTVYKEKKQANIRQQAKQFLLQQKEITRQTNIIQQYRSFNRQKSIKAAESRQKALDKMELVEKPQDPDEIRIRFEIDKSSGNDVLSINELSKSFGDTTLFKDISLSLRYGDCTAIIGLNGTGKTTLLKLILGQIPPSSGEIRLGTGVSIGYYDQEQSSIDLDNTVIDELWGSFPHLTQTQIRNALAAFLFKGDDVFKPISTLSGGERSRVLLCKLMLSKHNFLILDEPTNHLDMVSKENLEAALCEYPGTILVVSHDRYFLNKVADRIIVLENQGITEYLGNYDDYLEKKKSLAAPDDSQTDQGKTKTAIKEERRKERQERQRQKEAQENLSRLENLIHELENQVSQLEQQMGDPGLYEDLDLMREIQNKYTQTKEELDSAYEQWLEHSETES